MMFEKTSQIQFHSLPQIKNMGRDMARMSSDRRKWFGVRFTQQYFYNCLVAGVYEAEKNGLDAEDVKDRGVLAVVMDLGASVLERIEDKKNAKPRRGAKAFIGGRGEAAELPEVAEEAQPSGADYFLSPLVFPDGFGVIGKRGDHVGGAEGENKPSVGRRVP